MGKIIEANGLQELVICKVTINSKFTILILLQIYKVDHKRNREI